jgi:hypothetical protein
MAEQFVETYRGWDIYISPSGKTYMVMVDGQVKTWSLSNTLAGLKRFIDYRQKESNNDMSS